MLFWRKHPAIRRYVDTLAFLQRLNGIPQGSRQSRQTADRTQVLLGVPIEITLDNHVNLLAELILALRPAGVRGRSLKKRLMLSLFSYCQLNIQPIEDP
jgi:hypothetical protein